MPFAIRPMEERDILQAAEIERDAFPALLPPTPFRRELKNRLASYLVARRLDGPPTGGSSVAARDQPPDGKGGGIIGTVFQSARGLWTGRPTSWEPGQDFLVGSLGMWYMADQAHVVSVAVRSDHRGCGLGELLLLAGIEQAIERGPEVVTLEVRTSNLVAQNLYKKYGVDEKGCRKGYYSDNREDALIMTTAPIQNGSYSAWFLHLVEEHERTWGHAQRLLS